MNSKKLTAGWSLALAFAALLPAQTQTPVCSTPYCTVSASHVADASGKGVTGTIVFQATDGAGAPLTLHVNGSGTAAPTQVSAPVTNGAFTLSLADTAQTAPANACYRAYVANATGKVILGSNQVSAGAPLQCVQMNPAWCSGSGCNFDNYPTNGALWTVYPNVASALTLGGVLIPANSGLTVDGAGHLTVDWTRSPLRTINGQTGDGSGNLTLPVPTGLSQLTNDTGFVTAQQAANAAPVQAIQINGVAQTPVGGVVNLPIAANPIQTLQVNGVAQTPAAGVVNVVVPVDTAQLANGAGFTTAQQAAGAAPVQSVAGRKGAVTLNVADINGLGTAATQNTTAFDPAGAAASAVAGIPTASGSVSGHLSKNDWLVFNNKQPALGFTPLNPANFLNELSGNTAAVFTNLGLGSAARQPASAFDAAGAAATAQANAISVANANTAAAIAALPSGGGNTGGAVSPIQAIQLNGVAQTPVNGTVNLSLTGGSSPVQSIQVNGTAQTPVNGVVSLTVPAAQAASDWNASNGVTAILNKPTIPGNTNQLTNGAGFVTASGAAAAAPIQAIQLNGVAQTPVNGAVNLSISSSGGSSPVQSIQVNGTAQTPVSGVVNLAVPAAQVASDWGASSGVAAILNKPTIPTNNSQLTNGAGYVTGAQAAAAAPVQAIQVNGVAATPVNGIVNLTGLGGVPAGALSAIASTCAAGAKYVAVDQPVGQQNYTCSSANTWTPDLNLGASGALAMTNGSLDIVTSVVPRTGVTNTWTGTNNHQGTENFTGTVNFAGAAVTGLASGGANVAANGPYLQIGGVNYLPMSNLAVASPWANSGYAAVPALTQASAAPTVTTTGAGAQAPILSNGNGSAANWQKPIPAGKTALRVNFVGTTMSSASGFGILASTGGNTGMWCVVYSAPNNGAQATGLRCRHVSSSYDISDTTWAPATASNAWLGFSLARAGWADFQTSTDGGRTWTTFFSLDISNNQLGYTPTQWGFFCDAGAGAQILSAVEQ